MYSSVFIYKNDISNQLKKPDLINILDERKVALPDLRRPFKKRFL